MLNRNSKEAIKADIEHLQKMLSLLKELTDNSSHDSTTAEYLQKCIVDWIDELKAL